MDDYALLGLGADTSVVDGVALEQEKKGVVISCTYSPLASAMKYRLVFKGCHEIAWEKFPSNGEPMFPADLLGLSLQDDKRRKFAVLSTDTFELSFRYDHFSLEKALT
jgi:hypothetical protein